LPVFSNSSFCPWLIASEYSHAYSIYFCFRPVMLHYIMLLRLLKMRGKINNNKNWKTN
jgi:hypothetical protein